MDAKMRCKLEAQEMARLGPQIKLMRKLEMQASARLAKEARRQEELRAAEERRVKRAQIKLKEQEKMLKRIQQMRIEKERRAEQLLKEMEERRQRMMLMEAEEKERLERLNKQKELQLRRLELEKAKALKEPKEDMSLADHKCLPELSRVPGLILQGSTLSEGLMVLQFLHTFGKVLGFDHLYDLDLSVLQEGLLNTGDSMGRVQDLLVCMVSSAIQDPGVPAGHRSQTLLGEDLTNVAINRDNVSEILQIFMEAYCYQTEFGPLALSLRTRSFQAHSPSQKVYMLFFMVNVLTRSNAVQSEITKNMDLMDNLWKDKSAVEDKLSKLWSVHTKRTEQRDSSVDGLTFSYDEEEEDSRGEICEEEDDSVNSASVEELEKEIEKLWMHQSQIIKKLLHSQSQRSMIIGQDRYMRSYWLLPECGGVFVEGIESSEEMLHVWWRVSDVQQLQSVMEALHTRGIRESALKNLIKENMEYLTLLYGNSEDAFDVAKLEQPTVTGSWCVAEQAMAVDISQLQQVEALERRVVSACLQIKGWMHPEPQSEREDLTYQEHQLFSSPASWNNWPKDTIVEKLPDSVVRRPNNPLDIAVMRLAELERNIERSEDQRTPGMTLWHQALGEVRTSAQLSLCIQQLQNSIDWDRPRMEVQRAQFPMSRKEQGRTAGHRKRARAQPDSRGSCGKKAKLDKKDRYWLEMCRVLLAELEAHEDARPFLTPVNLRAKPWYRRIIKNPMDFSTIRKKLSNNQYLDFEAFITDVDLVFENCENFYEEDSKIGRAGRKMKEIFDKRWAELLANV